MTNQKESLNAAKQAGELLQQTIQELEQASSHQQIENARKQLRKVQGMVEQSELDLYTMDARE